jgi:alcohol dehydrogenase (NADP+)
MTKAIGYAATDAESPLAPFSFERRALRPGDVQIDILYCGVCHSDLHASRDDWHNTLYPIVPGHEIVGRVTSIGPNVEKFVVGDAVAIGCLVDSCRACASCEEGNEQYCLRGGTGTYNGKDRETGDPTYGGYSNSIVCREEFVLRVPESLDLAATAPLLCAGITTYSPLRAWNVGAGQKVAVVGLGGLGHMGVKFGVGFGAEVTVITTSERKAEDARRLGAHDVLVSTDRDAMRAARGQFDFILDTVPVAHAIGPLLQLLRGDGSLVLVGMIDMMPEFHTGALLAGRRRISGSAIGGIAETQEMLDFCAEKNILADIETIAIQDINRAYERMEKSDVKYRFVIDMASLEGDA